MATPFKTVQLQLRSNIEVYNSQGRVDQLPLMTLMTVMFKEYQLGSYKPREATKYETPFSATYVRQVVNGTETLLLDYLANIYKVGGEDQLAAYRRNMGLA
ncbi:Phage tail tube protein FII [compost metagenome]